MHSNRRQPFFFVAYLACRPVSTRGRASPGLLLPLDLPTAGKQTRRERVNERGVALGQVIKDRPLLDR